MSSSNSKDIVEEAERKAIEPYNKILAEYERLNATMHDVRRNVDFIISDMISKMKDTQGNQIIQTVLRNDNELACNNGAVFTVCDSIRLIAYNVKVQARKEAREQREEFYLRNKGVEK